MFRKVAKLLIMTLSLVQLCSCTRDATAVSHMSNICSRVSTASTKYISDYVSLYPKSTLSNTDKILKQLQQGSLLGGIDETVDLDAKDLTIVNIEPKSEKMTCDLMLPYNAKSVEIIFHFDTGDDVKITIPYLVANTLSFVSVDLPAKASKVRVRSYTYDEVALDLGDSIDLKDNSNFKMLSNNTLSFNTKEETRFLIFSEYGIILDDVTLSGKGTTVIANGAAFLRKLEEK